MVSGRIGAATRSIITALAAAAVSFPAAAQTDNAPLYELQRETAPRWFSFENQTGGKGEGGRENGGAKGHAFDSLAAGQSVTLAAMQGRASCAGCG